MTFKVTIEKARSLEEDQRIPFGMCMLKPEQSAIAQVPFELINYEQVKNTRTTTSMF